MPQHVNLAESPALRMWSPGEPIPTNLTNPTAILRAVATQFASWTGGALIGRVRTHNLGGVLVTNILDAVVPDGPAHGLLTVDHHQTTPFPVYVIARCFGDVWPPPPLGPQDPNLRIAPSAHTPQEFIDLVNQVLASKQVRAVLDLLMQDRESTQKDSTNNGRAEGTETRQSVAPTL